MIDPSKAAQLGDFLSLFKGKGTSSTKPAKAVKGTRKSTTVVRKKAGGAKKSSKVVGKKSGGAKKSVKPKAKNRQRRRGRKAGK